MNGEENPTLRALREETKRLSEDRNRATERLRAENEDLRFAVKRLLEWDRRRGYILPYAVRDPLHTALSTEGSS